MTTLIVDGDVVVHMACGDPWKEKLTEFEETGRYNREDLKGITEIPEYYPLEEDTALLNQCWQNLLAILRDISEVTFASEMLMAIKSPVNYRDDIYSDYKGKRNTWRIHNPLIDIVRRKCVERGFAIEAYGKEADDYIRIWAEESKFYKKPYVIASIDKDLLCIPGKHWNIKKEVFMEMSEYDAMIHYYAQLLQGDSTDNIPGLKNVGPVKALKALEGCVNERHCQEVVVSMYIEKHGDDWKQYLLANGKLIHIQKAENDYFTVSDWVVSQELAACEDTKGARKNKVQTNQETTVQTAVA